MVDGSAAIGKLMSAYADAVERNQPSDVPQELIDRGYGSFALPPLKNGILYKGKSDRTSLSGSIFPQPLRMEGMECIERLDALLGKDFCIVSKKEIDLNSEQKEFYEKINSKFLVLEESILNSSPWVKEIMKKNDVYILRPDRHIFGSTSDKITFDDLTEDLKERLNF